MRNPYAVYTPEFDLWATWYNHKQNAILWKSWTTEESKYPKIDNWVEDNLKKSKNYEEKQQLYADALAKIGYPIKEERKESENE